MRRPGAGRPPSFETWSQLPTSAARLTRSTTFPTVKATAAPMVSRQHRNSWLKVPPTCGRNRWPPGASRARIVTLRRSSGLAPRSRAALLSRRHRILSCGPPTAPSLDLTRPQWRSCGPARLSPAYSAALLHSFCASSGAWCLAASAADRLFAPPPALYTAFLSAARAATSQSPRCPPLIVRRGAGSSLFAPLLLCSCPDGLLVAQGLDTTHRDARRAARLIQEDVRFSTGSLVSATSALTRCGDASLSGGALALAGSSPGSTSLQAPQSPAMTWNGYRQGQAPAYAPPRRGHWRVPEDGRAGREPLLCRRSASIEAACGAGLRRQDANARAQF